MEQALKQRLIGAVVITALAAIFIPMLFDEPVENKGALVSELAIPEPPTSAFTASITRLPKNAEQVLKLPPPEPLVTEQTESVPEETVQTSAGQKKTEQQMVRWVIQVGSFSKKKNALDFRNKLRKQGFSAFVDSIVTADKGKLFRLRVGPELNKKRAEAMQAKLDEQNSIKSMLVSE